MGRRDVKTGTAANGKSEIFGYVKDGDQVVLPASDELTLGAAVVNSPQGLK